MQGNFVWSELYTRDVEAAKAFYAAIAGWTFESMSMPDRNRAYWIAKVGDKPVAGILDMRGMLPDSDLPHAAALAELSRGRWALPSSRTRTSHSWPK